MNVEEKSFAMATLVRYAHRYSNTLTTLFSFLAGLATWELISHITSPLVTASWEVIYIALLEQIHGGTLMANIFATLSSFAIGFLLATFLGVLIGLIMSVNKLLFAIVDPWVTAMRSTPLVLIVPLFIVAFGIGLESKVIIVIVLCIPPIILNTADGVRNSQRGPIDVAFAFGASRWQIFMKVLIPSALPSIIGGIRIAINLGLVAVVVAEFFGAQRGLGYMAFQAAQIFDTGTVYLGIAILVVIGVALNNLTYWAERRLLPWRRTDISKRRGE